MNAEGTGQTKPTDPSNQCQPGHCSPDINLIANWGVATITGRGKLQVAAGGNHRAAVTGQGPAVDDGRGHDGKADHGKQGKDKQGKKSMNDKQRKGHGGKHHR